MRPIETIPEMGEGKIKENDEEDEFKFNIFDILNELLPHYF
jgi:hypothetical protein